ncbi:hypothetical protein BJ980_002543 [Nocardioides daedukensis]|uniref:DUF3592 domain-containing protein n=1 Tax=Nocardioides daedukensis TaxID=634462 RepID=A0A7Y9S0E1_9ACTN|nr:hypothetical protein [Nocardioides daedukensis]NYG59620.1 hypothetical protein [Nocardioides daedukensis]
MSTTEPNPGSATSRYLVLGALLLSGLLAGWAIIRAVNTDMYATPRMWTIGLTGFALVVTVCALILWSTLADPRRALTIWHGIAASFLGVGAGTLLGNLGEDNSKALWFGVGMIVAAALLLLLGLSGGSKARRKVNLVGDLKSTGVRTTAVVLNRGYLEFGESTQVNTPVTFEFSDEQGHKHRVEKRLLILPADPIEEGQETELWYDPADPEDWDRIVVQLQQEHPAP